MSQAIQQAKAEVSLIAHPSSTSTFAHSLALSFPLSLSLYRSFSRLCRRLLPSTRPGSTKFITCNNSLLPRTGNCHKTRHRTPENNCLLVHPLRGGNGDHAQQLIAQMNPPQVIPPGTHHLDSMYKSGCKLGAQRESSLSRTVWRIPLCSALQACRPLGATPFIILRATPTQMMWDVGVGRLQRSGNEWMKVG